jgi:hypothetical protein
LVGADARQRDVGPVLIESVPCIVHCLAAPAVRLFVVVMGGLFAGEPRHQCFGSGDRSGGVDGDRVPRHQLVFQCATFGSPVAGEPGERALVVEAVADSVERVVGGGEVRVGGRRGSTGRLELRLPVGGLTVEHVSVHGDDLAQLGVDTPRVVDGGHGGVGDARERVGDLAVRVGIVGKSSAVVDGRHHCGVPGVGGLPGPGLRGVPAVGVERGGAEEMHVVPGTALGAVNGARPGMRHIRCPIGPGPLYEPGGQFDGGTVVGLERDTSGNDGREGPDGPVDERGVPVPVAGVEQHPVAALVMPVTGPAGPGDRGSGELPGGGESLADAVGEIFGLAVGYDKGNRGLGPVADDVGSNRRRWPHLMNGMRRLGPSATDQGPSATDQGPSATRRLAHQPTSAGQRHDPHDACAHGRTSECQAILTAWVSLPPTRFPPTRSTPSANWLTERSSSTGSDEPRFGPPGRPARPGGRSATRWA